jgi:hypothetical protein
MEEIFVEKWEQFEGHLSRLGCELEDLRKETALYVSAPLFRGQADSDWKLETTLERTAQYTVLMEEYFRRIRSVRPAVASLTGKDWPIPDDFMADQGRPAPPPGYEFMIYLRHHGFPSPLLDWSRSPYVAAYFAFRSNQRRKDGNVAIYSYVEYLGSAKSWSGKTPHITVLGPYVISHKRHYSQQCSYTICKKRLADHGAEYAYASHEDVARQNDSFQDRFVKYVFPQSERSKALDRLALMNITAFSLFGSEESLMETLGYAEIEKRILCIAPDTSCE